MSNMVIVKNGDFYYKVPMHEFTRYWLPNIDLIELPKVPGAIPFVSRKAGLERGKGVKRAIKAYEQKGSGKHAPTFDKRI